MVGRAGDVLLPEETPGSYAKLIDEMSAAVVRDADGRACGVAGVPGGW